MDRLQELHRVAVECLAGFIGSTSQYAVNVHPGELEQFREHLDALEKLIHFAAPPEDLRTARASFRGELRDYQQQVHQRVENLREEVKSAAAAMQTFADGVVASGADHEEELDK